MSSISEDDDRAGQSGHADDKVDDAQDARVRVEQARERLGETVEQLAAKADVKARTQVKAAEVKDRTQVKAAEVKDRTQVKAAEVKDRVQATASRTAHQVQEHTPEQVRQAAAQVAVAGRRHPRPLAAAVGAVVTFAVVVLVRRRGRKR